MTQRTEMQHRVMEFKSAMMTHVANKLFSFRQTGLDGFLKRKMLGQKPPENRRKLSAVAGET